MANEQPAAKWCVGCGAPLVDVRCSNILCRNFDGPSAAQPQRDPACVERWPECESGAYDPRCCRFPKSCSCTSYPPDESPAATPSGADLIAAERQRQIDAEDWTPSHDDTHAREELALAAATYAVPPSLRDKTILRLFWPWERSWFKPTDRDGGENAGTIFETDEWRAGRIRTLAKAGALVAAEIDRLQRRAES